METGANSKVKYRFGLFELDPANAELTRQGVRVRLQDQPLRVLTILLERPGEIVSREQIQQALWPQGTYVDFEGSLNAALKRLRSALDDGADNPVFIETVPRRGYRFIAPVSISPDDHAQDQDRGESSAEARVFSGENGSDFRPSDGQFAPASSSEWTTIVSQRSTRTKVLRYAAMAITLAVIAWQIVYWAFPMPPPHVLRRIRLTNIGALETGPIAAGADRVFFTARRGGRFFPMQVALQGGTPSEIETPFNVAFVYDISPDQANLLLGSEETRMEPETALWIWPVNGGAPHRFGDYTCGTARWSPDGRNIAFTSHGNIYLVSADGTGLQKLAEGAPFDLNWSPDGAHLTFTTYDGATRLHSVWQINRDGSDLRKLNPWSEKQANLRDSAWLKNGDYFAFWRGTESDMSLWMKRERASFWRRPSPSPVQVLSSKNDALERVVGHCAYDSRLCAVTTWRDFKHMQILAQNQKFASASKFRAYSLDFSPTGKFVALSGEDGGLFRCRAEGGDCIPLTRELHTDLVRWSPNGKEILFNGQAAEGPPRVHSVPADGSSAPRILTPMDKAAGRADWSPDGTQIVVSLGPPSDDDDSIYFLNPATGNLKFVTGSKGLRDPVWSPDGRWIAARDSMAHKIFFYNVAQRRWTVGPEGRVVAYFHWSRHSKDLFYQELGSVNQTVYRVQAGTTKSRFYRDFAEILDSEAVGCRLAGIGLDDGLYFYTLENKADLVLLDLDLP